MPKPRVSFKFFCWIAFYLYSHIGEAQSVIDLSKNVDQKLRVEQIHFFEDPSRQLTTDKVKKHGRFGPLPSKIIGKNFSQSNSWFRLIVSSDTIANWYFESKNVFLDSIFLYVPSKEIYEFTGLSRMMSERKTKSPFYYFEVPKGLSKDTIYFKATPSILSELELTVTKEQSFSKNLSFIISYSIIAGLYILYMTVNLIYYFLKRKLPFLILFIYAVVSLAMILHIMGIAHLLYYPEIPWVYNEFFYVLLDLSFLASLLFTYSLFSSHKENKRFQWLYISFTVLWITSLISDFLFPVDGSLEGLIVHHTFPLLSLIFQGSVGIYLWKKGNSNAILYSIGWTMYALLVVVFTSKDLGLLSSNTFIRNIPAIGGLLEMLFFTMATIRSLVMIENEKAQEFDVGATQLEQVKRELDEYLQESLKTSANSRLDSLKNHELLNKLSSKEFEVLQKVVEGKTNQKIADETSVSVNTVKTQIKSIYSKVEVHSRMELIKKLAG